MLSTSLASRQPGAPCLRLLVSTSALFAALAEGSPQSAIQRRSYYSFGKMPVVRSVAQRNKRWEKENQQRLEVQEKKTRVAAKVAGKMAIAAAARWQTALRKAHARADARALAAAQIQQQVQQQAAELAASYYDPGIELVAAAPPAIALAGAAPAAPPSAAAAPAAPAAPAELQTPSKKKKNGIADVQTPSKNAEEVPTPSNSTGSMNVEAALPVKESGGSVASEDDDKDKNVAAVLPAASDGP